jgi:hypothetical protein
LGSERDLKIKDKSTLTLLYKRRELEDKIDFSHAFEMTKKMRLPHGVYPERSRRTRNDGLIFAAGSRSYRFKDEILK